MHLLFDPTAAPQLRVVSWHKVSPMACGRKHAKAKKTDMLHFLNIFTCIYLSKKTLKKQAKILPLKGVRDKGLGWIQAQGAASTWTVS